MLWVLIRRRLWIRLKFSRTTQEGASALCKWLQQAKPCWRELAKWKQSKTGRSQIYTDWGLNPVGFTIGSTSVLPLSLSWSHHKALVGRSWEDLITGAWPVQSLHCPQAALQAWGLDKKLLRATSSPWALCLILVDRSPAGWMTKPAIVHYEIFWCKVQTSQMPTFSFSFKRFLQNRTTQMLAPYISISNFLLQTT